MPTDTLRFTLLADGPSDESLLPILRWLLLEAGVRRALEPRFADLDRLPAQRYGLDRRISAALSLFPCDLLFVHRDAERASLDSRRAEIRRVVPTTPATVPVVPVRMTEAWLLSDEVAIRGAAGNPNGRVHLALPGMATLEGLPDPKVQLNRLLETASELRGRRLKNFETSFAIKRIAELSVGFAALRRLPAFARLEEDIQSAVAVNGWV